MIDVRPERTDPQRGSNHPDRPRFDGSLLAKMADQRVDSLALGLPWYSWISFGCRHHHAQLASRAGGPAMSEVPKALIIVAIPLMCAKYGTVAFSHGSRRSWRLQNPLDD
jgi:hypothetical protein